MIFIGLELFHLCYAQFPNETELVRNMMGLIGNIAEVENFRCHLMQDEYINIFRYFFLFLIIFSFSSLLRNTSDGIEISYNSAGVLSHLVSDGEDAWRTKAHVPRDRIMKEITEVIFLQTKALECFRRRRRGI